MTALSVHHKKPSQYDSGRVITIIDAANAQDTLPFVTDRDDAKEGAQILTGNEEG